jgi:hypothetical protein
MKSENWVARDIISKKGSAKIETQRRFRSRFGFCPNSPPIYCPRTPTECTIPESIPPIAMLLKEKIRKEVL